MLLTGLGKHFHASINIDCSGSIPQTDLAFRLWTPITSPRGVNKHVSQPSSYTLPEGGSTGLHLQNTPINSINIGNQAATATICPNAQSSPVSLFSSTSLSDSYPRRHRDDDGYHGRGNKEYVKVGSPWGDEVEPCEVCQDCGYRDIRGPFT